MINEASLLSSVKAGLESLKQTLNSRGGLKSKAVDRYDKETSGRIVLDIGCDQKDLRLKLGSSKEPTKDIGLRPEGVLGLE